MAAWDVLNELRVYRPARIFEFLDPKVYVVQPQPDLLRYEARISEAKVPQFTSPKVIQSTIELGHILVLRLVIDVRLGMSELQTPDGVAMFITASRSRESALRITSSEFEQTMLQCQQPVEKLKSVRNIND